LQGYPKKKRSNWTALFLNSSFLSWRVSSISSL